MCESSFANTTAEFQWVAAGVMTELRAIIVTLEAKFNMLAVDRSFKLVEHAMNEKMVPLDQQAQALEVEHAAKLEALLELKAKVDANSAKATAKKEARALAKETLLAAKSSKAESTWEKASEPLRIELTTLGTTIALVVGMVVANLAHGRKGVVAGRGSGGGSGKGGYAVEQRQAGETVSLTSSGPTSTQYGAFQ